jgi:MOSC domain-containing protein YiiM
VRDAAVNELGLIGDDHRFPNIHGGPDRALCLFSLERILKLQAAGHPIFPGAVGENVTVAGLEWNELTLGVRLSLGDEVIIELTSYTTPCNTISDYFVDGNYREISQKVHPGDSRIYARVLQAGKLAVGQRVKVLYGGL